jgi:pimeloyl-ACP methyl ester carboxylesterase
MPTATEVPFTAHGDGPPVLLLPPAATRAEVWLSHQVPALVAAGFRAVSVSPRGIPPAPVPPGPYRVSDLVADVVALIERLGNGPCHLVGSSLGAIVAQELALLRPDLVTSAVLMGTRARCDGYRKRLARATAQRCRQGGPVSELEALRHIGQLFGPTTLADETFVADWVEMVQRFPVTGPGPAAQYEATVTADRRTALTHLTVPCLVMAFGADVLTPPHLCAEVAEAIPDARYREFPGLGHFGFLDDPTAVNAELCAFLALRSPALSEVDR